MSHLVLAVNPGSTSTKAALYRDKEVLDECNTAHDTEILKTCPALIDQLEIRLAPVHALLEKHRIGRNSGLDAVIGRGGLMHSLSGGVYRIGTEMIRDLKENRFGTHASNLGAPMACELADRYGRKGCPALIADPVVVDEMLDEARISGFPGVERRSIFHALNQKSTARQAASQLNRSYEELNLIVAHMGGGISVGAHRKGRVIDVNNALDGEGPFSPERSGTVPAGQLLDLVESGIPLPDLRKWLCGEGGLAALTGSKDLRELLKKAGEGNGEAESIYRALVLQVSQEICRHGATLDGKVDGIVLTGGLAFSERFTDDIKGKAGFLAEILVIPGERELQSLAENALAVLKGNREILEY